MVFDEHKRTLVRLLQETQEQERLARSAGRHHEADALADYAFTLDAALDERRKAEVEVVG